MYSANVLLIFTIPGFSEDPCNGTICVISRTVRKRRKSPRWRENFPGFFFHISYSTPPHPSNPTWPYC